MAEEKRSRREFLGAAGAAVSAAALTELAISQGAYAAGDDAIKIGVVGCGGRGTGAAMNAMSVDKGVRLVAMADLFMDRVKGKVAGLKKQKPDQVAVDDAHCFAGFDGYKRVIECVDVVLIACAAKFHPFYTKAAVEAGKHVFVEKPHGIDPAGIKQLMDASKLATEKKVNIVSGLQSRYDPGYVETVKRIHDGAIGDVVSIEENFLRAPYGVYRRQPNQTEMQYQFSNQYHFGWLCGDDVPQSLVHNLDRSTWVLKETPPLKCHGLGGRASMFDGSAYGNVFDHHSVIYHYTSGVRVYAFTRTETGCYDEVSSLVFGTKGRCNLLGCTIEGENKWHYEAPKDAPKMSAYDIEHKVLLDAIRSGNPVNNCDYMARSTLVTIMGQISCYTGKEVTWDQVTKSDFVLGPKCEECSFDMEPPVKPDEKGIYPVPIPGQTKMI
jgi:predicted dehydrogenase